MTNNCHESVLWEENQVTLLLICVFVFIMFWDYFWVSATFYFLVTMQLYFSLFKTQCFSYKSHIIKILFAIFDKFTILFAFKIKLEKKSIAKFINLKEKFDLWHIWRIRNLKTKRYTFQQKHISGLIQRHLDYFYISNSMQVSVKKVVI